jgi:hypothetical protein
MEVPHYQEKKFQRASYARFYKIKYNYTNLEQLRHGRSNLKKKTIQGLKKMGKET